MWLAEKIGAFLRRRRPTLERGEQENLQMILTLTLTLLALIIGFSFSMAVTRYDQRKNYEEAEANAIGTEYARASLLPEADAARVRELLKRYLDQRVLFYTSNDARQLEQINAATMRLQTDLWAAVQAPAVAQPTPLMLLVIAGMNDVLNSQGYTQAAWWNRIPMAAWALMALIAIAGNLLVGFKALPMLEKGIRPALLQVLLPLIIAIAFFLIADMDSPRRGVIRVIPQNLLSLAQPLRAQ
jgi:hypothetical protein